MRNKKWFLQISLLALLFAACETGPGQSGGPRLPLDTRILNPSLLEKDPVGYYELSWTQKEEDTRDQVVASLLSLMNGSEDNLEKLQYAMSLHGLSALDDRGLTQAYANYARSLAEEGFVGVAFALFDNGGINPAYLSNEQVKFFLDTANKHRLMQSTRKLSQEAAKRSVGAAQDTRWANQSRRPQEWLDAVGTVFVDAGYVASRGGIRRAAGSGSGFFIDRNGYMITNHHVIEMAVSGERKHLTQITVTIDTKGVRAPAKVVGYSKDADMALLKVEYEPDFAFDIASYDDKVESGQRIYALGSPLGLFISNISTGVITNTNRSLDFISSTPVGDIMQIDAAVNPGNSGGALVNDDGMVVGVVFSGIPQFSGISFALPADLLKAMLPHMVLTDEKGNPRQAVMAYADIAAYDGNRELELVYVGERSQPGKGGLENFKGISRVAGMPVNSVARLQVQTARRYPNTIVAIQQEGSSIPVVLSERPQFPGLYALLRNDDLTMFPAFYGAQIKSTGMNKNYVITRVYMRSDMDDRGFMVNDSFVFNGPWRQRLPDYIHAVVIRARLAKMGPIEVSMPLVVDLRGFNWA